MANFKTKYQKHLCQLVLIYVATLNQLFWKLTKKNLTFMRLILEEQQKYLQSFINNATYHPINPDADVTYQTVNLFSSDKCSICFISYLLSGSGFESSYSHFISSHYNSKVRIYHCSTCITYIYLYQNCTYSVVLISKSTPHCLYNFGKDKCTRYIWSNMFVLWDCISSTF